MADNSKRLSEKYYIIKYNGDVIYKKKGSGFLIPEEIVAEDKLNIQSVPNVSELTNKPINRENIDAGTKLQSLLEEHFGIDVK